jgi:hypothetical protein
MSLPAPLRSFPALFLLPSALALLLVAAGRFALPPESPLPRMDGWDVPALARHLESRGLRLHLLPAGRTRGVGHNAYLTETIKYWEDVAELSTDPTRIERWSGVVYCERSRDGLDAEVRLEGWGGCCLQAGPFLFFGDPSLLARIRDALVVG